jgi:hypothetical protein
LGPESPRRLLVDLGSSNHCIWRSHNFSRVLEDDAAKRFFLALLQKFAPRHGILYGLGPAKGALRGRAARVRAPFHSTHSRATNDVASPSCIA